ncbi:uncharacterized protein LOC135337476 isoform X2 [Halichondria panicea]|uniref:uncharacterized protein LOC135337476 isoform X2 n=1 Tax=Halichondria panicea TaxID=6063 RepID=UPI00312BB005
MAVYMKLYLLLALSALVLFSGTVNSQIINCTDTVPLPASDNSSFAQAESFTETNCSFSSNMTSCYERCLRPAITLTPGMDAYAECTVPENTNQNMFNRAKIAFYPPNSERCVRFQTETGNVWHRYDEHIHFRRNNEKIEVLILNVMPEHHNLSIICLATRMDGTVITVPEDCVDASRAIIYVGVEAAPENVTDTVPTSTIHYTTMGIAIGGICPPGDNYYYHATIVLAVLEAITITIAIVISSILFFKVLSPQHQNNVKLKGPEGSNPASYHETANELNGDKTKLTI